MNLKLAVAASLFAAIPTVVYAQQDVPTRQLPEPTMADVQKLVQTIKGDKAKLQAYCEMGDLLGQIGQAEQRKDTKAVKTLGARLNGLAQQLGPNYIRIMGALDEVDPNSAEGKRLDVIFEPIVSQCK